jgi:hypothetical protein
MSEGMPSAAVRTGVFGIDILPLVGGSAKRSAVITLLIMNDALKRWLDLAHVAVSAGFSRLAPHEVGRRHK